jgi:general secretion pathway protein F
MPVYAYRAFDVSGRTVTGMVSAESEQGARSELRNQRLFISEVSVQRDGGMSRKVSGREVAAFTRQLALLCRAGVPLSRALAAMQRQSEGRPLQRILADVAEKVHQGRSLADAFAAHARVFGDVYVNTVRAGESTGGLDITLANMAVYIEKHESLKHKIRSAMAYPALMTLVGAGVLVFLLTFVVPGISQLFEETGKDLPTPTALLIALSTFLRSNLLLLAGALGFLVWGVRRLLSRPRIAEVVDRILLKLPVAGPLLLKSSVARFSRTLSTLLAGGVSLVQAIEIVEKACGNREVSRALAGARVDIHAGCGVAPALQKQGVFPPVAVDMVAAGESSGQLETMLAHVADMYEEETSVALSGFTSLIEPVVTIVMGAMVGFIVLSILMPIFEMNQLIG